MNKYILILVLILVLVLVSSRAKAQSYKYAKDPKQILPQTIGFQTNNPTNINAQNGGEYEGQIGEKQTKDGLKRVFSSIQYGCLAASQRLQENYLPKGLNTVEKIAKVWTGGNAVESWIKAACEKSGFGRSQLIGNTTANMRKLVKGMVFAENSVVLNDYYFLMIK